MGDDFLVWGNNLANLLPHTAEAHVVHCGDPELNGVGGHHGEVRHLG